jgi:tetratricopeptide (TPR) repeat protein
MQARNYQQAKESFTHATKLMPDHTQAYFGLFTACARLGQKNEAVAFRKTFVQLESNDRKDLNDRSSQSEALSGITAVRETTARTLFGAGQIHQSQGAFSEAADLFYQSAALAPDDLNNRMALETVHVQRKTLEEGVKAFERLIASQPGNALNHYFLGRLETRRGNASAAEKNYQKPCLWLRHGQRVTMGWPNFTCSPISIWIKPKHWP